MTDHFNLSMKYNRKSSIASRVSVRSLVVVCMPVAALTMAANSPVPGAVFSQPASQDLTTEDNAGVSTNGASTHAPSTNSSIDTPHFEQVAGQRG